MDRCCIAIVLAKKTLKKVADLFGSLIGNHYLYEVIKDRKTMAKYSYFILASENEGSEQINDYCTAFSAFQVNKSLGVSSTLYGVDAQGEQSVIFSY
jgi:hypothetical protein